MDPLTLIALGGAIAVGSLLFSGKKRSDDSPSSKSVPSAEVSIDCDWNDSVGASFVGAANNALTSYCKVADALGNSIDKVRKLYAHDFKSQRSRINYIASSYESIIRKVNG